MPKPPRRELPADLRHLRIIDLKELQAMVPYTAQHILRLEKAGRFPRRLQIGQNRVGWLLVEIEEWISARAHSRSIPADKDAEALTA